VSRASKIPASCGTATSRNAAKVVKGCGRGPGLQAGGRRFDPGWLHQMELKIDDLALAVFAFEHRPRNITSHVASFTGCACGISDIVKRRLIRVWDLQSNLRNLNRNLQVISALVHRKMDEL
jgi:hypothetical protein